MQKYFNQLVGENSPLSIPFERFIFTKADQMVEGYDGGVWETLDLSDGVTTVTILLIPDNGTDSYTVRNELSGTSITTDRITASAAFTCLVTNWFWHATFQHLSLFTNDQFTAYHYNLRDVVYADRNQTLINTNDYFTLTD